MNGARRPLFGSAIALWVIAPILLTLGVYRPHAPSTGRAAGLPRELPGYTLSGELEITERHVELLGTSDVAWRSYAAADGREVEVIVVYHESNWKALHPPHMCIEGSNMAIRVDRAAQIDCGDGTCDVGIIEAFHRGEQRDAVSLYVFAAPGLRSSDYWEFVMHHAPRALLRQPTRGFLLRVATWVDDDGVEAAQARCADFVDVFLPAAEARLEVNGE